MNLENNLQATVIEEDTWTPMAAGAGIGFSSVAAGALLVLGIRRRQDAKVESYTPPPPPPPPSHPRRSHTLPRPHILRYPVPFVSVSLFVTFFSVCHTFNLPRCILTVSLTCSRLPHEIYPHP